MAVWQQFLMIAGAHFLALISPGPDFFLIVRSAVVNGPRVSSGVCVGIALANAVYILAAICGVVILQEIGELFFILKWAGCAYLAWLGWRFFRSRGEMPLPEGERTARGSFGWWKEFRIGFLSGILNPKNSLFYASLFSLGLERAPLGLQLAYGAWMFMVVLFWDLGVARAAGHPALVKRFVRHVRKVERVTGAVLLSLAAGIAWSR